MRKYNLHALVAAGLVASGITATRSFAADLGGNCCADLEERIAELEATTARKGNRKVSLTLSGWVGQQISFWDDGNESNIYIHDLGTTLGSHVKFTGAAQVMPGVSAGYVLHIEGINSDSLTTNQNNSVGPALYNYLGTSPYNTTTGWGGTQVLQSYWFMKSEQLGKVSLGRQSQASDNAAILVDGSGSLIPANWVAFDTNSFFIQSKSGPARTMTWGQAQGCFGMGGAWGDCNGLTQNVVRYDSPTLSGFSVSTSWGADDMWDVAGRYAGEGLGFKLAATVAYNEVRDSRYNNIQEFTAGSTAGTPLTTGAVPDMNYLQVGAFLMHVPTGLFGVFNYGHLGIDGRANHADTYYAKLGLRTRLSALGHSVFYGEYLNGQDGGSATYTGLNPGGCTQTNDVGGPTGNYTCQHLNSELQVWGGGIVQELDAAAMSVWVKYRNLSYDSGVAAEKYHDFNYVGVGGLINF